MAVPQSAPATASPQAQSPEAYEFVAELAEELGKGRIDLPSFPSIVSRIRRALSDDRMTTAGIARIVAAEPALATRVLMMANSAESMNTKGGRVSDLPAAVARLGMNTVQSASIAFAFEQMKRAEDFKSIQADLAALWQRSVLLAAMSHVTARRVAPVNAGAAMLAGLLHGVGKLYILSRASLRPQLFQARVACQEIVNDWHATVAKSLLESWEMPEEIVAAVHEFENPEREMGQAVVLTDVLAIAALLVSYQRNPAQLELDPQVVSAAERLDISRDDCEALLRESEAEVAELLTMLGPLVVVGGKG